MNIARFELDGAIKHGVVDGSEIRLINGSIFNGHVSVENTKVDAENITLLSPVAPGKIVCVGLNYKEHAKELGMKLPDEPVIFMKPPSAVIGDGADIVYPQGIGRMDYEAELAVIIRKRARRISPESAVDFILGYTCLNDVTARDLQKKDGQWTRAKSFDTFCPVGPWIVSGADLRQFSIKLFLNKKLMQSSSTDDLIFGIDYLISFISNIMTLDPGDIIATGTPSGVGPMKKGDEVEVSIGGIGSLKNRVI